ncbi:MAG: lipoprotein-releasing ABC transporter permease subunit [Azospirillum sp.]|nr:lipoprotein-releasing ABC transporter permease subunit [Azospirillum sp.]MCZ8124641.1 lipoprotein-releasing ABC transporter permease subunit [Magnetospirillum sp.]
MAFGVFERMVAMRYLRARRQEGFISVIAWFSLTGIALGVATLIIVMAVMNGFRAELLGRILGLNGHMTIYGANGPLADWANVTDRLRALPDVIDASPLVEGQAMASANGVASGALVRALRPEDMARRSLIAGNVRRGALADFAGDDAAAIGVRMASRMGLSPGDRITLISPQGNVTAFGTMPRLRAFRVVAIYETGMFEYDNAFVFLPMEAGQTFFRTGEDASGVEVFVRDPQRIWQTRQSVVAAAGQGVRVLDWQQANSSFFNAVQVERNVMFLILTLIILVAAFNIVSSLIMLVKDKSRDIAILRTMGASRGAVLRIFFMAGASVGVLGTLAGLGLGVLFNANIEHVRQFLQWVTGTQLFSPEVYFLATMPSKTDPREVVEVVIMALALSFLATIYPAWRAARLDPVEALRYE